MTDGKMDEIALWEGTWVSRADITFLGSTGALWRSELADTQILFTAVHNLLVESLS
jgi:hypothetical protein